jgi:hypothetical protein
VVWIGIGVGVDNGAGELEWRHRGTATARGSAPASWAAVLVNVWHVELQ